MPIFDGAFAAGADYLDMAMSLSKPHPDAPYEKTGRQARRRAVRRRRRVGGRRPAGAGRHRRRARALRRVRAVRRRPPVLRDRRARHPRRRQPRGDRRRRQRDLRAVVLDVDHDRGVPQPAGDLAGRRAGTPRAPFSEPEVFDFPEGIGPVECVNVEHEEVLLMPRWVDCKRATFKYGLGDEFINILKVLHTLGLDRTEKVRVKGVEVSPRDVVAAVLPDPATVGPRMKGKTCAGLWVTGKGKDGAAAVDVPLPRGRQRVDDARSTATSAWSGRPRSTPWSPSSCSPRGTWSGAGVLGPEAFDAVPFLDLLTEYGSPWGQQESERLSAAAAVVRARTDQALRRRARRRRPRPRDRRRRVLLDARPVRLGQDHGAADDRRLRAARRAGTVAARRRGRHRRGRRSTATSTPSSRTTRSSRT